MSLLEVIFGNGGLFWIFLFIVFWGFIAYLGISRGICNEKNLPLKKRVIIIAVTATAIVVRLIIFFH